MNLGGSCARQGSPLEEGVEQEAGEGGLAAVPGPAHRHDGRRHGAGVVRHRLRGFLPLPLPLRRLLLRPHDAAAEAASGGLHGKPLTPSPSVFTLQAWDAVAKTLKGHWKEGSRGTRRRGVEVLVGRTASSVLTAERARRPGPRVNACSWRDGLRFCYWGLGQR
jgi:hypothetical protein